LLVGNGWTRPSPLDLRARSPHRPYPCLSLQPLPLCRQRWQLQHRIPNRPCRRPRAGAPSRCSLLRDYYSLLVAHRIIELFSRVWTRGTQVKEGVGDYMRRRPSWAKGCLNLPLSADLLSLGRSSAAGCSDAVIWSSPATGMRTPTTSIADSRFHSRAGMTNRDSVLPPNRKLRCMTSSVPAKLAEGGYGAGPYRTRILGLRKSG
jgi:hypothetical protein